MAFLGGQDPLHEKSPKFINQKSKIVKRKMAIRNFFAKIFGFFGKKRDIKLGF